MTLKNKTWVDYVLWLLIAIGFFGIVKVSWENLTGNPCPHVFSIPICYVVLLGYSLMVLSVVFSHGGARHYLFVSGWSIATSIAVIGSVAEFALGGGVCPSSGGGSVRGSVENGFQLGSVPLCYVSLALLLLILLFFIAGPYKRVCDVAARGKTA